MASVIASFGYPTLTLTLTGALLLYGVVLAVYRLFFHPLRNVPGPKLAAMTHWYEVWFDMIKMPGQFVFHVEHLHKRYGPVVRINPAEVHINDLEYLDQVYASSAQVQDKPLLGNLEIGDSLAGTADFYVHKKRRQAMGTFFSKQSVARLEPRIRAKIDNMCKVLEQHAKDGEVVNLADLLYGLSYDVTVEYSFGIDSARVLDEQACRVLRENLRTLFLSVKVMQHFPFMALIGALPVVGKDLTPPGVLEMQRLNKTVGDDVLAVLNDKNDEKRSEKRSIFYDIRNADNLPPEEKAPLRLQREGAFLVMAGTESTAGSNKITLFHILNNAAILAKIREELSSLPERPTLQDIEQLPYLTACIHEGNRLSFGITIRNPRMSRQPLQFGDVIVPPGFIIATSSLAVCGNDQIFPDPFAFKPDRWLGAEGRALQKYTFAFGRGARRCIGINLAHAQMYLTIAALVSKFDLTLYQTDVTDVEFKFDYQVAQPKLDSKGVRATVRMRT